jgi:hypothetical protein
VRFVGVEKKRGMFAVGDKYCETGDVEMKVRNTASTTVKVKADKRVRGKNYEKK